MKNTLFKVLTLYTLLACSPTFAAADSSATQTTAPELKGSNISFFATVNNIFLTKGLLDLSIKAAVAQGQKNTPELQKALKDELINRELLAQQAERIGLEKEIDLDNQYTQLRQNLLIQALVDEHFKKSPISDEQLRQEYERQRKLTGGATSGFQYFISEIVLANESEAIEIINRIHKGESFNKLAQQFSIANGAKSNGGQLGWLFPGQLSTDIQQLVAKMNKGSIHSNPIRVKDGWGIIKLDDKRSYKLPGFEDAKPQLRQAFIQQFLMDTLKDLRVNAKITQ